MTNKDNVMSFNDSSRAEIEPDGSYDLVLPNRKHVRGVAERNPSLEGARTAVIEARNKFILQQWEKGGLLPRAGRPGNFFQVPLDH